MMRFTRERAVLLLIAGVWAAGLTSCSRDVRLANRNIRSVTVRPVTHYGINLNEAATPKEVAYVALRAIREDFLATTPDQREAALDIQFDVAAANVIQARNRTQLERDEFVHNVVYRWTPTVSNYVNSFDTEWEKANRRLLRRVQKPDQGSGNELEECEVLLEVDDPSSDPSARVVIVVWLAKDSGYWRVVHLGFDRGMRSIAHLIDPATTGG